MEKKRKKQNSYETRLSKLMPCIFAGIALLIILLPLERPVKSLRSLLSYIFIPQIRAAHSLTQYLEGVSDTVSTLLVAHNENLQIKDEIELLKISGAQMDALEQENARLTEALKLSKQMKWKGIWAKTAYREPARHSAIIIDKGSDDGIELRAPVIGVQGGQVGLVGKVIEVTSNTAKVLLSADEDFSVAAYLSQSGLEGLCAGDGKGGLNIKYIPLEAQVKEGDKVYTGASSAIFPDGILIGTVSEVKDNAEAGSTPTFLLPKVAPVFDTGKVKEVFVMPSLK